MKKGYLQIQSKKGFEETTHRETSIRGMQTKRIMRCNFSLTRLAKSKQPESNKYW